MGQRAATRVRLQLLGVPTWATELGGGRLEGVGAVLFGVIATEGAPEATRLAEQVWGPQRAGNNLHSTLNRLRDHIQHDVVTKGDRVVLHPDTTADIHAPPDAWPDGDDPARVEFMHGIDAPPALRPWLDAERERWRKALGGAQHLRRAEDLLAANALAGALDEVRRAITLAPFLPEAWLAKAQILYVSGDLAGAARALARAGALRPLRPDAGQRADSLRRSLDGASSPRPPQVPPSLLRPPRLIGRDAAWRAAERAWEAQRPFVFIGEHGVGKSRLLRDFIQDHGGGLVVEAAFQAERAPYATLATLVQRVRERLGLEPGELPSSLAAIEGPLGDARFDEAAILAATREWLGAAAVHLGAIAVDRLERADTATVDLLRKLAAGPLRERLRFAFASLPMLPGARREQLDAWCAAREGLRPVALAPWTVEQVAELLSRVELPRAAARITPADLRERSCGVPQLVLFTLQELAVSDRMLPARREPPEELPVLRERLRAVPPGARPLLELSAVLEADVARLAQALECSELEVLAIRDELAMREVLDASHTMNDMTRDAVLAAMPSAALVRWNAVAATLLAPDPRVPRARIAAHWEAAERWAEAAAAYREAGARAAAVGSAAAALDLYQQAALCAARGGDAAGEFEALHEALPHEMLLHGLDAARRMLERMRPPAEHVGRQVRLAIREATLEVSLYRRGPAAEPALRAAMRALAAAQAHRDADLLAAARSTYAVALAQTSQYDQAVDEGRRAWAMARVSCLAQRAREIGTDLSFVYYEATRLGDAISLARELLDQYEAAGDVAGAAAVESNLAALLARSGDPEASLPLALEAYRRLREVEPTATHMAAVVNRVGLSQALGFKGELTAALAMLTEGGRPLDEIEPTPQVRAMVQAQRAHLLLLLGDDRAALAALGDDDGRLPVSQRIQAETLRLRATRQQGGADAPMLRCIETLLGRQEPAPLPHSQWWAASLFGDPGRILEQLLLVQRRCVECGMPGVARSVDVRRLQVLMVIPARWAVEEAGSLAQQLSHDLSNGAGLAAMTYWPEAWLAVARALQRAGYAHEAAASIRAAQRWVVNVAERHVAADRQHAFLKRNPVHLALELLA